jgi:uncharacterized protein (TIGR02266 family)
MLRAFRSLDQARHYDPENLTSVEMDQWDHLRKGIEHILFQREARSQAEDTRRHLRVPVRLAVRYYSWNSCEDRWLIDLSEGGLFLEDGDPLPAGSRLILEIEGGKRGRTLGVKGEVVWKRSGGESGRNGMGIRFTEMTADQEAALRDLVDERLRAAAPGLN